MPYMDILIKLYDGRKMTGGLNENILVQTQLKWKMKYRSRMGGTQGLILKLIVIYNSFFKLMEVSFYICCYILLQQ